MSFDDKTCVEIIFIDAVNVEVVCSNLLLSLDQIPVVVLEYKSIALSENDKTWKFQFVFELG
jgi:hypothetical protein